VSATFLEQMAAASLARVREARRTLPEAALARQLRSAPPPHPLRLSGSFDLIAELKLRSPAAGPLGKSAGTLSGRVAAYGRAGAAAVSVLTEPERFDGALAHLHEAAAVLDPLGIPAMRKDFLVDPYQVLEARAAGAGGVLAILRMLGDAQLDELISCAHAHGLFVLLEAFDATDVARLHQAIESHPAGVLLAGVNCRDLTTLQVVPARLQELAALLPSAVPWVAESGVATPADATAVAAAGYRLILVGSALMRDGDPEALAGALLAAGRQARREA
jgi:indole-3-glycerol phosphate synthase